MQIIAIIDNIQTQLDMLRTIIATNIPIIQDRYTAQEATIAKAEIEKAFENGLVTWDKKRGLKMLVTKRTIGWRP